MGGSCLGNIIKDKSTIMCNLLPDYVGLQKIIILVVFQRTSLFQLFLHGASLYITVHGFTLVPYISYISAMCCTFNHM